MAEQAKTDRAPDVEKPENKAEFLVQAVKRFNRSASAEAFNRKEAVDDLRFKMGQQWPADIKSARTIEKRPCLTINKVKTFVHQITNDQRQNRPAINVSPVGDKSDPNTAKMLKGLIKQIERQSNADIAYDTGFDNAVSNGWGYWRVFTEYESEDTFDQVIRIGRIRNPFRVYLDPDSQEPDGSDAKWGFISDLITREEFKDQYPNAKLLNWEESGLGDEYREWVTLTHVRVAEYFYFEYEKDKLVQLQNGHVGYKKDLSPEILAQIEADPSQIVKERDCLMPSICWDTITAHEVLESHDWAGKWIPIVKVIGDEVDVEGKNHLAGIVRDAKDPQRMYNFWPLSLDTPIPTPYGWREMGNLHVGDLVFNEQGERVSVLAETPIYMKRECLKVHFDNGSAIVADTTHKWAVEERGKRRDETWGWTDKVIPTGELVPGKHFIHTAKPLSLYKIDLLIHPYLLGAWLGDGASAEPRICGADEDLTEIRSHIEGFGHQVGPIRKYGDRVGTFTTYGMRSKFSALGLLGDKHIPPMYLRASKEQRELLLQGLMDTDGSITGTRQCEFTTISDKIAFGFSELLASLGIKSVSCKRQARVRKFSGYESQCQESYQFSFCLGPEDNVFRLSRKKVKQGIDRPFHWRRTKRHRIVKVESVPSVPVKCVMVEGESHQFLVGLGMIPTHNCTAETELLALAPKAPWVMEEGQVEGQENRWKEANTKSFPYLLYKNVNVGGKPAPPPQRQQFTGPPAGVVNAKIAAAQDMQAVTGIRFDATMQERMYDESGKASESLKESGTLETSIMSIIFPEAFATREESSSTSFRRFMTHLEALQSSEKTILKNK